MTNVSEIRTRAALISSLAVGGLRAGKWSASSGTKPKLGELIRLTVLIKLRKSIAGTSATARVEN